MVRETPGRVGRVGRDLSLLRVVVRGSVTPLAVRFRLGEGLLLALNLSVLCVRRPGAGRALAEGFVSLAALALCYAVNDLHDAASDGHNPKKRPAIVRFFLAHRRTLLRALAAEQSLLALGAARVLGPGTGAAVLLLFVLNAAYSAVLKRVPVADVVTIGVGGAVYARLVEAPWQGAVLVGLMTGTSHVFQMLVDRRADARVPSTTTAVWSYPATLGVLLGLCALLTVALAPALGAAVAATALVPFVLACALEEDARAWLLAKTYFGVVWLALLVSTPTVV